MRDHDFAIDSYPAIPDSDITGFVVDAGLSVPAAATKVGTRVTAFAPTFFTQGDPDHEHFKRKFFPRYHEYVKKLGASKVFDYKDSDVVENIVKSAKKYVIPIDLAYDAAGALQFILDILKAAKGDDIVKLASVIPLRSQHTTLEGVDIKFIWAPTDDDERKKWSPWLALLDLAKGEAADGRVCAKPKYQSS
ncbi:hypothetical protein NHQ30_003065 [Ciborinia camelliae]|nr:hypothetical protein NHQ30_003065 [Ciborinia camelliae]